MRRYYAITHNQTWELGDHDHMNQAEDYAVDKFNIHQAPGGYLILNRGELIELLHQGWKIIDDEKLRARL
jgi:hypothetical protein